MSDFTTQVRYICESYCELNESVMCDSVEEVISNARTKIFDFEYPIFDEKYKYVLETKILKHYYMREIGAETVGLWKLWLNTKLNEVMPYYNQLYKSQLLEFNPFYDVDITRTHHGKGDSSGESSANDTGWNKFSATPQGGIQGLENDEYLTEATKTTNENKSNTMVKTTDEYLESVKGKQNGASYSSLLLEYRKTFLNIDVQVINELSDLFMKLW